MLKVYYADAGDNDGHDFVWTMLKTILDRDYNINFTQKDVLYTEHKKPYIKGHPIHFNLSHHGRLCVVAVSDVCVGVDAESRERLEYNLDNNVYEAWLSEKDLRAFAKTDDKLGFLTQKWTEKEAVLKMIGSGILNVQSMKNAFRNADYEVSSFWIGNYCLSVVNTDGDKLKIKNLVHFTE